MQIKAFVHSINIFLMENYLYLNKKGRKMTIVIIRALKTGKGKKKRELIFKKRTRQIFKGGLISENLNYC